MENPELTAPTYLGNRTSTRKKPVTIPPLNLYPTDENVMATEFLEEAKAQKPLAYDSTRIDQIILASL